MALHAVSLVPVAAGSTALVVGAGTIGLLLQQALRVAGCSRVFVTDVDPTRLKLSAGTWRHGHAVCRSGSRSANTSAHRWTWG